MFLLNFLSWVNIEYSINSVLNKKIRERSFAIYLWEIIDLIKQLVNFFHTWTGCDTISEIIFILCNDQLFSMISWEHK